MTLKYNIGYNKGEIMNNFEWSFETKVIFTNTKNVELTDRLGEALMKTVINNGLILLNDSNNYDARAEIMWASALAHNGLLDTGRNSCWASHIIATKLSAHYNSTHGIPTSLNPFTIVHD